MKKMVTTLAGLILMTMNMSFAQHQMQHGFIISGDDQSFSHLVATGHHSYQLNFEGSLSIPDQKEFEAYLLKKTGNVPEVKTYFLFQAQKLDLPATHDGQVLSGHIVESPVGGYTPENIIVKKAEVRIKRVQTSLVNPFFIEP